LQLEEEQVKAKETKLIISPEESWNQTVQKKNYLIVDKKKSMLETS